MADKSLGKVKVKKKMEANSDVHQVHATAESNR
jgi:hypothetical protein